jgi:predicted nuclease with RNAse H fold
MRTLGIDLASKPEGTAMSEIDWETGDLALTMPATDEAIVQAGEPVLAAGGIVAIDAPFGWPTAFVEAVSRYEALEPFGETATIEQLRFRATDLAVPGRRPLSVSSDLIGVVAFRAARLLDRLGSPPRDGSGGVIEVYPAAALRQWDLERPGYRREPALRQAILTGIAAKLPRLQVAPLRDRLIRSPDALDSLVSALVARAKDRGRVVQPTDEERKVALREGWLWVPLRDSLGSL